MDPVSAIARAVLYEGYILWPYRRGTLKNQQRWTFGGIFPQQYSTDGHPDDAWLMRAECLVEGDAHTLMDLRLCFLHVVDRSPARTGAPGFELLDSIDLAGERYVAWEEAAEREIVVPARALGALATPAELPFDVEAGESVEWLDSRSSTEGVALVRRWHALTGTITTSAEQLQPGLFKVAVEVQNRTAWREGGARREQAAKHALVSTHVVLHVSGGELVSATNPPPALAAAAAGCRNVGTWPVLVGQEGTRDTMLAAPIILYDYPQIAPESPGDLFDGTEIDQLLVLDVLSLTDDEQQEMRAADPRAREILERCQSLSPEALLRLNGAVREMRLHPDP